MRPTKTIGRADRSRRLTHAAGPATSRSAAPAVGPSAAAPGNGVSRDRPHALASTSARPATDAACARRLVGGTSRASDWGASTVTSASRHPTINSHRRVWVRKKTSAGCWGRRCSDSAKDADATALMTVAVPSRARSASHRSSG